MMLHKKYKGFIFDLDGTVLDSSWVWDQVDIKFLGDRGFEVPDDYVEAISPLGAMRAAVYTIERFGLYDEKPEDMVREWFDMAKKEYANKVVCKPGAKEYIKFLYDNGIKLAVATSSDRELFMSTLAREGILECFSEIVTVEEVERGKGYPDIYEEAARRIGLGVKECVVFEDILTGVSGAKLGDFTVVAVEDEKSLCKKNEIMKKADLLYFTIQRTARLRNYSAVFLLGSWANTIATKISAQPMSSRGPIFSFNMIHPAITEKTDSKLIIRDATVGFSPF